MHEYMIYFRQNEGTVRSRYMPYNRNRRMVCVNLTIIAVNFMYFAYLEIVGDTENSVFMIEHGAMFLPAVLDGES